MLEEGHLVTWVFFDGEIKVGSVTAEQAAENLWVISTIEQCSAAQE